MNYTRKIIFSIAVGTALVTACNKDSLHELNINPQALNSINPNFMFTSAQLGAASGSSPLIGDNRYLDWRTNIGMASTAIQQMGTIGGISNIGDKYGDNSETSSAPFEFYYPHLTELSEVLTQTGPGGASEGKYANLRQAARILRVFLFQRLTDFYNRVPYFETMQAAQGVFFPKYDSQKEIYADLFKELEEATAAFGAADPSDGFAAADLYYGGDIGKWKKWGYSIMLQMAMRVSNVAPDWANTYVAKAVAGGVFQSNADNALVPMAEGPNVWIDQNGISRAYIPGDGGEPAFLSKRLIDFLKGPDATSTADDDPRLMILTGGIGDWTPTGFTPVTTDPLKMKGLPNGNDQNRLDALEGHTVNVATTYSRINPLLLDRDEDYMMMNYGEVELLLAEAAERGIGGLTAAAAQGHYEAGVKASMQMYTIYDPSFVVSDAEVAAYLATYPYGSRPKLEMIGEQYWVNHFLNWWEAWSNWRRTSGDPTSPNGYPVLTPINFPGNVTNGTIPQRLKYPNIEVGNNPNFTEKELGMNNYTTRVWWAGGPE